MVYLMIVLASVYAHLNEHTLGPFMNSTSIDSFMQSLAAQNSSVVKFYSSSDPKYVILDKNPVGSDYKRGLVLFVGSLHGGSLISSYAVLSYLEQYVNDYTTNSNIQEVVDGKTLIFMPIANYPAYKLFEEEYYNKNNISEIPSGLEYLDNCNNLNNVTEFWPGIDPDRNFPSGFEASEDKCDKEGTSGSSSLLSNISSKISSLIDHPTPLVFNFADEGSTVLKPYSKSNAELSRNLKHYYEMIQDHVPEGYEFETFSNYYIKKGSLIDYAVDKGGVSFEVRADGMLYSTDDNKVANQANETFEFVYNAIKHTSLDVKVGFDSVDYSSNKCVNYSMCYDFKFYIHAQTFTNVLADIDLLFEFGSNFSLYNFSVTKLNFDNTTEAGSQTGCNKTDTSLTCKEYKVEGYSLVNFVFQFGFNSSNKISALFNGNVTASKGSFYFSKANFSDSGHLPGFDDESSSSSSSSDDDHDNRRGQRGVMVGLVLLIVLLILLIIAGVILYCTQQKKEEPAGQFAAGNAV